MCSTLFLWQQGISYIPDVIEKCPDVQNKYWERRKMASGADTEESLDSLAREAEQLKIKIKEEKMKYHDKECKLQNYQLHFVNLSAFSTAGIFIYVQLYHFSFGLVRKWGSYQVSLFFQSIYQLVFFLNELCSVLLMFSSLNSNCEATRFVAYSSICGLPVRISGNKFHSLFFWYCNTQKAMFLVQL